MADALVEIALRRISQLREELSVLEKFVASYKSAGAGTSPPDRGRARNDWPTILGLCQDMISERSLPMVRKDLHEGLLHRGVRVVGERPSQMLGTQLWRSDQFVSTNAGYWLSSRLLPAGYELLPQA